MAETKTKTKDRLEEPRSAQDSRENDNHPRDSIHSGP